jgi:serine/threonine-protein kinase
LRPGFLFDSRYEIVNALGRGGMGTVYKARDIVLDELVAIKVLRADYAWDEKMAERFKSEIKLARKVRHKNVCTIHDFGEFEGLLYISMELIEGIDLKKILKEKGAPPKQEAYDLAIQIALGLEAVHEAGIIHRDLKAANVMRDAGGVVRLMDFGVAKQHGSGKTLTTTGQVIGTPEYMSPEQAQGHKLDFRSDVYALGILIYELFAGRVPFRGDTPVSTILKQINDPPPLYGPQSSAVPGALVPILRKALAKTPTERHRSVRELIEELEGAQQSITHPQAARPTAVSEGTTRLAPVQKTSRPWSRFGMAAGAAVLIVAFASWLYWMREPTTTEVADSAPSPFSTTVPAGTSTIPTVEPEPTPSTSPPATSSVSIAATVSTTSVRPPRKQPPRTTSVLATSVPTTSSVSTSTSSVALGPGWLQVVVTPWATVTLDGKLIGETPLESMLLPAGKHTVVIRHPNYEPIEREVTVVTDESIRLVVNLRREGVRKKN